MADISAKLAAQIVADKQADDAIFGLCLDGELTVRILEQRTQQSGEHQRFGQKLLDHRRIVVIGKDCIEYRPDASGATPRMPRRHRDAQRDVLFQGDFGHRGSKWVSLQKIAT
jgi:hypothetical protein